MASLGNPTPGQRIENKADSQRPEHFRRHDGTPQLVPGIRVVHPDGEEEHVTTKSRLRELNLKPRSNRADRRRAAPGHPLRRSPRAVPLTRDDMGLPPLIATVDGRPVAVRDVPVSVIPARPRKDRAR